MSLTGEYMEQKAIVARSTDFLAAELNQHFADGWTLVPFSMFGEVLTKYRSGSVIAVVERPVKL